MQGHTSLGFPEGSCSGTSSNQEADPVSASLVWLLIEKVSLSETQFFHYEASGMRWPSCSPTKNLYPKNVGKWAEDPEEPSERSQFGMTDCSQGS